MTDSRRSNLFFMLFLMLINHPAVANGLRMDKTEISIAAFAEFVAATGIRTTAERDGGMVYEAGWVTKPGWNWRTPYGMPAAPDEPAVHITFDEAASYCRWRGQRLPTRVEWIDAGYTERRRHPAAGFVTGTTYHYPTGDTPAGAHCLDDCAVPAGQPINPAYQKVLLRGAGHLPVGRTRDGVNGLFDMGANVWEWASLGDGQQQATLGGSWWYGARQMQADYGATKPRDMAAVYIGFRCLTAP